MRNHHWRLDPERSNIEFHVPNFYGLMTVSGTFTEYEGTLELPNVDLKIDAASLDTGNARRDKHLRSADFFDVEHHPHVRFTSTGVTADGENLKVRGQLEAGGERIPLEVDAALRSVDGELEIEATAYADQRRLGMTFSPLGTVRSPAKLTVHGRLVAT